MDVPAGVTQEEGHTGFLIHLPSAVHNKQILSIQNSTYNMFQTSRKYMYHHQINITSSSSSVKAAVSLSSCLL